MPNPTAKKRVAVARSEAASMPVPAKAGPRTRARRSAAKGSECTRYLHRCCLRPNPQRSRRQVDEMLAT